MNETENQPQDLPDYLREEEQNTVSIEVPPAPDEAAESRTPLNEATAAAPPTEKAEETTSNPAPDLATESSSEPNANTEAIPSPVLDDIPPEPEKPGVAETTVAKESESETTVAEQNQTSPESATNSTLAASPDFPSPYSISEAPEPLPEENELETTVVRRKSLFSGQNLETVTPVKPQENPEGTPQWQPRPAELLGSEDKSLNEATVLAGASIKPAKISRAGAHVTSLVVSLLALPFAWGFLKHANGLLYSSENSTWETGNYSIEGLIFLVLGLALIVIVGLAVRLSSLGSFLAGIIMTVVGIIFVITPSYMKDFMDPTLTWLSESSVIAFRNLAYFLESSAFSGQFLVIGVVMLMIGVVGHTARRRGRTDQIADKALARVEGLKQ